METVVFKGQTLKINSLSDPGIYELRFDRQDSSVNKLDNKTINELREAIQWLNKQTPLTGLLISSAKSNFIVGADIQEFGSRFSDTPEKISHDLANSSAAITALEDLNIPTVVAIDGYALGGGLELALACDYRIASKTATLGLPEVSLGIYPGYGGTVRLPRIVGFENACRWIASGAHHDANTALSIGVVDDVITDDDLHAAALQHLKKAIKDPSARIKRKEKKLQAMLTADLDNFVVPADLIALSAAKSKKHEPAVSTFLDLIKNTVKLPRDIALERETTVLGQLVKTQATASLIQSFLNRQKVQKIARNYSKSSQAVNKIGILGGGIMGSGIAISTLQSGIAVSLSDIDSNSRKKAESIVQKYFAKSKKADVSYELNLVSQPKELHDVDFVIEAIVESLDIKKTVLSDLENNLSSNTILASNTSSLRIDDIASCLRHPERFVGMHFFNPVPRMPLVEVVRGKDTSAEVVATAVTYARTMGKTPIVVKDCAGFLVNRIFTAYMSAFLQLIIEGADFERVDQVMESFGWPMGPACLEDVIGLDTGSHVNDCISAAYPDRMPAFEDDALRLMVRSERYGRKNGKGFYDYEKDDKGRTQKVSSATAHALVSKLQKHGVKEFGEQEIIDRMMLPMIIEASVALEEGIVDSAAELDTALLLGLGFPAYIGGPLQYADFLGMPEIIRRCAQYASFGPAYLPSNKMHSMAKENTLFHNDNSRG